MTRYSEVARNTRKCVGAAVAAFLLKTAERPHPAVESSSTNIRPRGRNSNQNYANLLHLESPRRSGEGSWMSRDGHKTCREIWIIFEFNCAAPGGES